jgi:hypothetical protein
VSPDLWMRDVVSLGIHWYTKGHELFRVAKLRPFISLFLVR